MKLHANDPRESRRNLAAHYAVRIGVIPKVSTTFIPLTFAAWRICRCAKAALRRRSSRNCWIIQVSLEETVHGALSHLQLGRAKRMMGDQAEARKSYEDFLTLWTGADPDIPIYQQAKTEYAKLHASF